MINTRLLDKIEFYGDVDALESYTASLKDMVDIGGLTIPDEIYTGCTILLKKIKPESIVLKNDPVTIKNKSNNTCTPQINIARSIKDFVQLKAAIGDKTVDILAFIKPKGYKIKAVYKYGELTAGYTTEKDILKHLKVALLNKIPTWDDIEEIGVYGEILIPLKEFKKICGIFETPLRAATFLLKNDILNEKTPYLNCVCYKLDIKDNRNKFKTFSEEMDYLDTCGFKTPDRLLTKDVDIFNFNTVIDTILNYFKEKYHKIGYESEGIGVVIDNKKTFYNLENTGSFLLKMGEYWEENVYSSKIKKINWTYGHENLKPTAVIEPTLTVTGEIVHEVPLYDIETITKYNLIPGNEIYFKFGGEPKVVLIPADKKSIDIIKGGI